MMISPESSFAQLVSGLTFQGWQYLTLWRTCKCQLDVAMYLRLL